MARSGPIPPLADRIGLWPARVVWASLPVTVAPALDAWLGDVGSPAGWIAAVAGWIIWFAGLLTLAVPSTVALTALRILAPLVPAAAFAAFADAGITTSTIVAAVVATAVMGAFFQPVTGDAMVNGSAYGSERRLALRPPAALLLGPLQVTWLLTTGPLVAGAASGEELHAATARPHATIRVGIRNARRFMKGIVRGARPVEVPPIRASARSLRACEWVRTR